MKENKTYLILKNKKNTVVVFTFEKTSQNIKVRLASSNRYFFEPDHSITFGDHIPFMNLNEFRSTIPLGAEYLIVNGNTVSSLYFNHYLINNDPKTIKNDLLSIFNYIKMKSKSKIKLVYTDQTKTSNIIKAVDKIITSNNLIVK